MADYLDFFGFREHPFLLTPDPAYFFPASPHIQAMEVLAFALKRGEGFMVLTGEAGTGKSLLLRRLLDVMPDRKATAVIIAPPLSPVGVLELLLKEISPSQASMKGDAAFLLKELERAVLELAEAGRELVVIIDEAQNLPAETIEQLRLLSNIELSREKLVQILLVGQPELEGLLRSPSLGQLMQRITVHERLRPLNMDEMRDYVKFRLTTAGRGDISIAPAAFREIYRYSRGIPRLINKLMDRVLLRAAAQGGGKITSGLVKDALSTLPDGRGDGAARRRLVRWWALAAVLILVLAAVFSLLRFAPAWTRRLESAFSSKVVHGASNTPKSSSEGAENGANAWKNLRRH